MKNFSYIVLYLVPQSCTRQNFTCSSNQEALGLQINLTNPREPTVANSSEATVTEDNIVPFEQRLTEVLAFYLFYI